MTNIVGGSTGNISQPGSTQDGSSSNPLSKNASLDFLSLISVAYEWQKDSIEKTSKLDNADKSLNTSDLNVSLDLPKGKEIISQIEDKLTSDDIAAFLKGLNISSDKDEINVGISTLQLLGRLSKTEERSSLELNETSVATAKDFIKEFLSYIEINSIKSDQALTRETGDISTRLQNFDKFQGENPDMLNFINSDPKDTYTSDVKISENSASFVSLKKLPFTNLTDASFEYEQNDQQAIINNTSFLFNTDNSNGENLSEKKVIEIKVTKTQICLRLKYSILVIVK